MSSCCPCSPSRTAVLAVKLDKTHLLGMTDQLNVDLACIDESSKPIGKVRLTVKQYIFFHAEGHEEMFKKSVSIMTATPKLIKKNNKYRKTNVTDPYLSAAYDELTSDDHSHTTALKCGEINDMWSYDGSLMTVKYFFTARLVVDGKRDPHVHCEIHIGNGKLSPLPPSSAPAQKLLRTPIGAGIDNSEYIHETDFTKDTLPYLIHEMSYNRIQKVKELCEEEKWKKEIADLSPAAYAEAVSASYGEIDQVAVAKVLAQAMTSTGITCRHVAAAVKSSLYYKKELAREIGPLCSDFEDNYILISAQLDTWGNICSQEVFNGEKKGGGPAANAMDR
jgi:hypothetical protein